MRGALHGGRGQPGGTCETRLWRRRRAGCVTREGWMEGWARPSGTAQARPLRFPAPPPPPAPAPRAERTGGALRTSASHLRIEPVQHTCAAHRCSAQGRAGGAGSAPGGTGGKWVTGAAPRVPLQGWPRSPAGTGPSSVRSGARPGPGCTDSPVRCPPGERHRLHTSCARTGLVSPYRESPI